MNFDFSDEQKLLQKTARDYLSEHAPLALARSVLEAKHTHAAELWKAAGELGWLGAAVPESYGGAGFGHLELALLAEELGRVLAPLPFSSSVYLATEALLLAGSDAQKQRYLPRLAAGERIGTLAWAEGAGRGAPDALRTRFEGGRLSGTKLPVPDGQIADLALVLARERDGVSLALAELDGEGVERVPLRSIDPSRPLSRLVLRDVPAERLGAAGQGGELLERVLDRAAVLMAFEQLGSAARAFELTREYTLGRYAFGRPVASFQVVKHRLADLYAALELARSNAYYGAWALVNEAKELPLAACSARVGASTAFELAGTEMIQLYGGVGYTWEFDCHLFYRRAKHLSLTLGSPSEWREKLIRRLEAAPAA